MSIDTELSRSNTHIGGWECRDPRHGPNRQTNLRRKDMADTQEFTRIRYEKPDPQVARVTLARPETRNAQDRAMLYELDRAFQRAALDPAVKVIILAADGPHFSSGHDTADRSKTLDFTPVVQSAGHHEPGAAGMYAGEEEYYVGWHGRWRNLAKPRIAQVKARRSPVD